MQNAYFLTECFLPTQDGMRPGYGGQEVFGAGGDRGEGGDEDGERAGAGLEGSRAGRGEIGDRGRSATGGGRPEGIVGAKGQ
jgi:hypothetical protein